MHPPRWAVWIVARLVAADARDAVLGDLEERYARRASRSGASAAKRWYRRQALAFVLRVPFARAVNALRARRSRTTHAGAIDGVATDIRLAIRTLRRRPALAVVASCIVGLAIGANTTVLSVIDGVLLRGLPFPSADRLVMLWDRYPADSPMGDGPAPITLRHVREWMRSGVFETVGAFESTSMAVIEGDFPERIDGAYVTASLLPMLGARAHIGRLFLPGDERAGAEPVVLLGHDLWSSRFGADPAIVGRAIDVDGEVTRVIGVLADGFWFYDPYAAERSVSGRNAQAARIWKPLRAEITFGSELDYPRYRVIARVREGVSIEAASAAASTLRAALGPTESGDSATVAVVPLEEQVTAQVRPRLAALFAAVLLVLVIACVNLVSLLLVNLDARRSEFAVRAALGAARTRLARQLIIESSLLALCGGLIGIVISLPATQWLLTFVPRGLPLAHRVQLNLGVVSAGIGLALACGILIGAVTAWRLEADRPGGSFVTGQRTMTGGRSSRRLHGGLVTSEVALSLVLLIAATLLLRSFAGLRGADTGFSADGVLTFHAFPGSGDHAGQLAFFDRLEESMQELPGVLDAGSATAVPFSRWFMQSRIDVPGTAPGAGPFIAHRTVSPGFFDALGITLRTGRFFGAADRAGAPAVAVVNQAFVDQVLGGDADVVGRTVTVHRRGATVHAIVGVVANVKEYELFESARPMLYTPIAQEPVPLRWFVVRTAPGAEHGLIESIRRLAAEIDPQQPLQGFMAFESLVAQSMEEETFYTQLVTAFAATALLLTLVGIYGVVSYTTRQRDREVGIRMALGARARSVQSLVLSQGLLPVGIGLGLGCLGALASTGLLRGLIHGIPERDAMSYATAVVVFALVAAAACFFPARRAARLDPVRVLRGE